MESSSAILTVPLAGFSSSEHATEDNVRSCYTLNEKSTTLQLTSSTLLMQTRCLTALICGDYHAVPSSCVGGLRG